MRKKIKKSVTERGYRCQIQMLECRDKIIKNSIYSSCTKKVETEDFFKTQVEMKDIPDAINGRRKG